MKTSGFIKRNKPLQSRVAHRATRKRKKPIKTLKRKAWEVFARYVRNLTKMCVTCGIRPAQHCGHYLRNSERNQALGGNALWYDERNFAGQCVVCNNYNGGEQAKFAIYLEKRYGHGILQELSTLRATYKLWTIQEIEAKFEKYGSSQRLKRYTLFLHTT